MLAIDQQREERPAWVQFEQRAVQDYEKTREIGHVVMKNVDYVLVTPPYSKDCFEFVAEKWFINQKNYVRNGRIPQKWLDHWEAAYDAWKRGLEPPINGVDIRNWPLVSPAQVQNLVRSGCRSVEDLANANDEALRRIGMGGIELRQKAIAFLKAAENHGPLVTENEKLRAVIRQLESEIAALQKDSTVPHETTEEDSADEIFDDPKAEYEKIFGKPPHHKMKEATIKQKIAQAT